MKSTMLVMTLLALTAPALAQDYDMNRESLADEYAECAAYMNIALGGLETAGMHEEADAYARVRDDLMAMAVALRRGNGGRELDMAVQMTAAVFESSARSMLEQIGHRNENLAILSNQYLMPCVGLYEAPSPLVLEALAGFPE